jgi:NAD(P)-dependent dehydrogenase (short-subunit alcohol dehydrogenase family)
MQRIAIVTGGASGIGRALAVELVARGDAVVLLDIDPRVGAVATEIGASGPGSAAGVVADVRDAAAVRAAVEETVARHGRLDLMVNNAGIGVGGFVEDLSPEHWDRCIDVNLKGVINGVLAAYPVMIAQGSGQIASTASGLGLIPAPLLAPYVMTKHGVVGLSLSLRAEAAGHGVRVNVICPGVIDTPILDQRNPADLPSLAHDVDAREYLTKFMEPMPADAFARAALRGLDRDEAIIIAPAKARVQWWIYRLVPSVVERRGRAGAAWARARFRAAAAAPRIPSTP